MAKPFPRPQTMPTRTITISKGMSWALRSGGQAWRDQLTVTEQRRETEHKDDRRRDEPAILELLQLADERREPVNDLRSTHQLPATLSSFSPQLTRVWKNAMSATMMIRKMKTR